MYVVRAATYYTSQKKFPEWETPPGGRYNIHLKPSISFLQSDFLHFMPKPSKGTVQLKTICYGEKVQ